jgi:hypothetical protein
MNVLVKSAWGSDDPTKAAFPFLHANALAEAGHSSQIFLLGEAVSLMRTVIANSVVPVGWPPAGGGADEGHRTQSARPRVRGVREGPWGPRERSGWEERDVREPDDLRRPGAVGGEGADRIARMTSDE